jgi:hypothetical protein
MLSTSNGLEIAWQSLGDDAKSAFSTGWLSTLPRNAGNRPRGRIPSVYPLVRSAYRARCRARLAIICRSIRMRFTSCSAASISATRTRSSSVSQARQRASRFSYVMAPCLTKIMREQVRLLLYVSPICGENVLSLTETSR